MSNQSRQLHVYYVGSPLRRHAFVDVSSTETYASVHVTRKFEPGTLSFHSPVFQFTGREVSADDLELMTAAIEIARGIADTLVAATAREWEELAGTTVAVEPAGLARTSDRLPA